MPEPSTPNDLRLVAVMLCERCLAGAGGECHTPGCALWMNRAPDVPVSVVANLKVEMTDGTVDWADSPYGAVEVGYDKP